ncbi:MAG: hypothetical protein ACR2LR_21740 [Hassallia sp.]
MEIRPSSFLCDRSEREVLDRAIALIQILVRAIALEFPILQ